MHTNTYLGRFPGLDPAGPFFGGSNAALHLDRSDAEYVDVIHTDWGFAGTPLFVGHIHFLPNGGRNQPGCPIIPNLAGEIYIFFTGVALWQTVLKIQSNSVFFFIVVTNFNVSLTFPYPAKSLEILAVVRFHSFKMAAIFVYEQMFKTAVCRKNNLFETVNNF